MEWSVAVYCPVVAPGSGTMRSTPTKWLTGREASLRAAIPSVQYKGTSQSKSIERNGVSNGSDLERLVRGENGASGPTPTTFWHLNL